ncbi:MAG: FGGY family carbohydrate kinase [Bellilinea sp.]
MKYLLSLDIGTTSVKAGLFDERGGCLATALEEYQLITPAADRVELDAQVYWRASKETIRRVISKAAINGHEIAVTTVSSQGETLIILNEDGQPVGNAIVWMDNRAVEQARTLAATLGADIYDVTGIPEVVPTWPACKILWIKQNEPERYSQITHFLLVQDYLIYLLTGNMVTDGSISCTTLLYDIVQHDWWQKALNAIGIQADHLPRIQSPGSIAGKLSSHVAAELGLSENLIVVCGGMDQCAGAIGAGNIEEGVVSETTGAALTIQVTIRAPLIDPARSMPVYVHSVPGRYLFVPVCPTAGMAFKWLKDNFIVDLDAPETAGRVDLYEIMNQMSESVPEGCDGLIMLPHLMGVYSPVSNPSARGSFTGFTLLHKKAHFVRAVQEAVAYMLRQNIDVIGRAGVAINEIRTSGGAARSSIWNQIKADVCGLPIIRLENEDTGLVGDAILGGVAAGVFKSIDEGVRIMVHRSGQVNPGESRKAYNGYYQRYVDLDATLKDYFIRNYSN